MDISRRPLIKSIGGTTAALALAGCITTDDDDDGTGAGDGTDDDGPSGGSLQMWTDFTDAEEDDVDGFIDEFESETGHTINREDIADLDDQLETAMPAEEGPETWAWAHDWVGRFAVREDPEFLYDASDDIDIDLDVFSGAASEAVQFDGGVYGLPWGSETVALFYNEDMVDAPPETLDEMVDMMEDFHNPADGEFGLSYPATDPYFASGYLQVFGGDLYDEAANEVTLDAPEVVDGLERLEETLFNYIPSDPGYESQVVPFAEGNAPFAINGPWELGNFADEIGDVGVAELPTVDGNHPRSYSGIQMWYFSAEMARNESAREATVDWAEWYTTNQEVTAANAENHGVIPVHTEHIEDIDISDNVEAFSAQVDHGVPIPTHPDMDSVWDPAADALTDVFNGDDTAQSALESAAERIRDNI